VGAERRRGTEAHTRAWPPISPATRMPGPPRGSVIAETTTRHPSARSEASRRTPSVSTGRASATALSRVPRG